MATTGYVMNTARGSTYDHTNANQLFYAGGTWWCFAEIAADNDWYLMEYDGTTPASPGDTGGWGRAQETGAGDLGILCTRS